MDNDQPSGPFYKAMMTGVFTGFCITIVCLVYNLIFRGNTNFIPADIINVSTPSEYHAKSQLSRYWYINNHVSERKIDIHTDSFTLLINMLLFSHQIK